MVEEEIVNSFTNFLSLISILERWREAREQVMRLLGYTVKVGVPIKASFRYEKTLGELPPSKEALLRVLREYSYAPYEPGMKVLFGVNDYRVYIAKEGEGDVIGSGFLGGGYAGEISMEFFLKLALYFDEKDWEEMRRIAAERLRETAELVEKLKAAAAAMELLLK